MKQSNSRSNNKHLIANIYVDLTICLIYLGLTFNPDDNPAKWCYSILQIRKLKFQEVK